MKKLLLVIGLALAWTACGQGVTTNQALNVTDFGNSGTPGIPGLNLMGWSFTPTKDISIIELGCFTRILGPEQTPISVGLWAKDTGTLLKSVDIPSGDPLQETTYIPINEISLIPFQVYYIGAYSAVIGGISLNMMDNVAPPKGFGGVFSAGDGIQVGAWATNSVFAAPVEVTDDANPPNPAIGVVPAGANFRYRVPEPSSVLLGGLAALGLLALRRRRK